MPKYLNIINFLHIITNNKRRKSMIIGIENLKEKQKEKEKSEN